MINKINILHICNQLGVGGTEKALSIFAKYLNKDIFNVYIGYIKEETSERANILKSMGFEIYHINNERKLIDLITNKKIHIVHIHRAGYKEPFIVETAKKAECIGIVETNVFGYVDNSPSGKLIDIHLFVSKMCAMRYMKWRKLSPKVFSKNCKIVYNPIDFDEIEKYKPSKEKVMEFKEELNIGDAYPIILRVSRPDPIKLKDNTDLFMKICSELPNVKFILIGYLEHEKEKIIKSKNYKNFILLKPDYDDIDMIKFYSVSDILFNYIQRLEKVLVIPLQKLWHPLSL